MMFFLPGISKAQRRFLGQQNNAYLALPFKADIIMRRCLAAILSLFLLLPVSALAADLTINLECYLAELVKQAIKAGEIRPDSFGVNSDGDLVILFAVTSGGYWMGLVIEDGARVCGLSAGPVWEVAVPGQPT